MFHNLIQRLTKPRFGPRRKRSRNSTSHYGRIGGLLFEHLEERALLAALSVEIAEASISENGGVTTAIVSRDSETSGDLVVNLTSSNEGEATVPSMVRIPDGQDTTSFTISAVDEQIVDLAKTITITATADTFDPGSDAIDITNDDSATLSISNATVVEGDEGTRVLSFPVTLTLAVDVDISVDYTTHDGTAAAADGDYVPVMTPATLTVPAGDTLGAIDIMINGDMKVESDETVRVLLSDLDAREHDVTLKLDWVQIGEDIDSKEVGDTFGGPVSASGDGKTVVIGSPYTNGTGRVRVYRVHGDVWSQLGQDLDGEGSNDRYGESVALSSDGNTVAIGARDSNINGPDSGHAGVYRFDGTNWIQLGQDLIGEDPGDRAGQSVSLSEDGNTVAIGAPGHGANGFLSGRARVYRFDGTKWNQLGLNIDGEGAFDGVGELVALSHDGNTLMIQINSAAGQIHVFRFDGTDWKQLGRHISGERGGDSFGSSVSASKSGNTIAIGAPRNDGNGTDSGRVRVYHYDGDNWTQLGQDIDGRAAFEFSGGSVSLSDDGETLAIGTPFHDGIGIDSGQVRVFRFNGTDWIQHGDDVEGRIASDQLGASVSLSDDGTRMAIGARRDYRNADIGSQTREYRLQPAALGMISSDDHAVTIEDATGIEGDRLIFSATLSVAVEGGVKVDVMFANETAVGGNTPLALPNDYHSSVVTLSFSGTAGETKQFAVATFNDDLVEATESFSVTMRSSNAQINDSDTATGTIVDNDATSLRVGNAMVHEPGAGTAVLRFPVTLERAVDVDISVDYKTRDGTATASDGDYVAITTPEVLTINAGELSGNIDIAINSDSGVESNETLSLLLSNLQAHDRNVRLVLDEWIQSGMDIDGGAPTELAGSSVSLNDDGTTLVIGAPGNGGHVSDAGRVLAYRLNGAKWNQLGHDIFGEMSDDRFGSIVSVSGNGMTLAIGGPENNGNGENSGHVRVYRFDGLGWIQLGSDIDGEAAFDRFGDSISLAGDGNTIVVGAARHNGVSTDSGYAQVYQFDGTDWTQLGPNIEGRSTFGFTGRFVSLSADGSTVAVVTPQTGSASINVYRFDGVNWNQIGDRIQREDLNGPVSLSDDGGTVAVGAVVARQARVFQFDGFNWNQLGSEINGESSGDYIGTTVSLSGDGYAVLIGTPGNDGNGDSSGQARVYRFDGSDWLQVGQDMDGDAVGDKFGSSVSLSGDGNTVVVGAPFNDRIGIDSGHARVYRLQPVATGKIVDVGSLLVEFSTPNGTNFESQRDRLPQLLVTGAIQEGHSVTLDVSVAGGTATGGGVDFNDPMTVTIPAGAYDATPFPISGLSITPDTLIEPDETIVLGTLTGSQIEVGDANGDGTIQDATIYTIQDDDLQRVQTTAEFTDLSTLTITDTVSGGTSSQLGLTVVNDNLVISDLNSILGNFTDNTTGNETSVPLDSLQSIEIDLADGDDQVTIDFSNAPQGLSLSVTILGGDGHDMLTFSGQSVLDTGELRTSNDVEDIFVNGPIVMQSGAIALVAAQSLEVNADINLGSGSVELVAGRDIFGNCSLIEAGDANVDLTSGTGIGNVRIKTTGDVSLNGGSGAVIGCSGEIAVQATTLTLEAGSSVGTAILAGGEVTYVEPLRTSVNVIQGTVGGMGLFLQNDRSLIDNVELTSSAPMGIRSVCQTLACVASEGEGLPLHNIVNQLDVNNDGSISPVDVLGIINYLNSPGSHIHSEGSNHIELLARPGATDTRVMFVDVNGDRSASALDALIVINHLNRHTVVQPEGELKHHRDRHTRSSTDHLEQDDSLESMTSDHPIQLPAMPSSSQTTSYRRKMAAQTISKDDELGSQWELLLNALANDIGKLTIGIVE